MEAYVTFRNWLTQGSQGFLRLIGHPSELGHYASHLRGLAY